MKPKKLIIGITAEGSVNLLLGQLAHFKSLGYETFLLGPYSERSAQFCKEEHCVHLIVDIEREISPIKDFKTLLAIIKIFKEVKPDIINFGTPKVSLLGMFAGAVTGVKRRIYTCRGFRFENESGVKRRILEQMEKITGSFAKTIICISPSLKNLAVSENVFNEQKTIVINKGSSNGLNLSKFALSSVNMSDKNKFIDDNKLKDKFVFGFVGRLVKEKGLFELLAAFEKLYAVNKDVHLIFLGSDITSSDSEKKALEKYKNHPAILFLGFQTDVPFYMSIFDVMVLPSHREGFGNVYIQAAAMEIPCIGCNITGVRDAVSHNFNGLLVEPKSENELYDAMKTLYFEKDFAKTLGNNGLLWAKNFDREIIWQQLHKIYSNAI
jgi:glycosyltransferase involved in cell wall biosynthesis